MVVHTHIHIHILDRRVDDLGMSSLVSAISIDVSVAQSVERGLDSLVTGVRFSPEALTFHSSYTMGSLYIGIYICTYWIAETVVILSRKLKVWTVNPGIKAAIRS